MRNSRTLLAALPLALLAPLAPAPAHAADAPPRRIDPSALATGPGPRVPYLDLARQTIVDGDQRVRLTGRTTGKVRAVHDNGDDGWVALSSSLNRTGLYRVDPDGSTHRIVGDRENPSILVSGGRVAQQITPNDKADLLVAVYDVATGERVGRLSGNWIDIHAYRDGLVWLTLREEFRSPEKLVTWNPDTGEVVDQGLRDIDGVDLDQGAAWRWPGLYRIRVLPLSDTADWEAWGSLGFTNRDPVFSPDGEHVVTYTRDEPQQEIAGPGAIVVRDADTGQALRKFTGSPTGGDTAAHPDTAWEDDRRFVTEFWDLDADRLRSAQVRLTLGGRATRVSPWAPYAGISPLRAWVHP